MLERLIERGFDVRWESHARAILASDYPTALQEIEDVLANTAIPIDELIRGGGGETPATQRMRRSFEQRGWNKCTFTIRKVINDVETQATSHIVDHVKGFGDAGTLALEIEWNNKDPFFDRDLDNFKRLHADGAIDAGVIITRGSSLHATMRQMIRDYAERIGVADYDGLCERFNLSPTPRQRGIVRRQVDAGVGEVDAWASQLCRDKYGEATTHWNKLDARIRRGAGNPCPLLLIGIPASCVVCEV